MTLLDTSRVLPQVPSAHPFIPVVIMMPLRHKCNLTAPSFSWTVSHFRPWGSLLLLPGCQWNPLSHSVACASLSVQWATLSHGCRRQWTNISFFPWAENADSRSVVLWKVPDRIQPRCPKQGAGRYSRLGYLSFFPPSRHPCPRCTVVPWDWLLM